MNKYMSRAWPLPFLLCIQACSEPKAMPPSVLLISIDMLRADHVSCYGYDRNTTPTIDALAARGARMEQTISSAPWTLPAHTALFTSLSDSVHGVNDGVGVALAPEVTTLAERFQEASYSTAGFYAGPYLHDAYGLGQGFDTYRYCVEYADEYATEAVENWGADPVAQRRSHHGVTNPSVYAAAQEWLASVPADQPFFGFVHLWDAHYDFTPPAPYDTMFTDPAYDGWVTGEDFFFDLRIHAGMEAADLAQLVALYDGEIRWTDAYVGKLLGELQRLGRAENTLIVVVSDHGTELFDHGKKGHRRTLYDEALRVPLVFAGPGVPVGQSFGSQVSLLDVAPTLLDLCALPGADAGMGRSLLPMWQGAPFAERKAVSELLADGFQLRSLREPGSKLVQQLGSGKHWRFDLEQDPLEGAPRPESIEQKTASTLELEALEADFSGWRVRTPDPVEPGRLPRALKDTLSASGYGGHDDKDDDK